MHVCHVTNSRCWQVDSPPGTVNLEQLQNSRESLAKRAHKNYQEKKQKSRVFLAKADDIHDDDYKNKPSRGRAATSKIGGHKHGHVHCC